MKKVIFVLLILVVLLGTVACAKEESTRTIVPTTTQTSPAVTHGAGYDSNGVAQAPPVILSPAPVPTIVPTTMPAGSSSEKGGVQYSSAQPATTDRLVIRNAYLTLVVDDVSNALAQMTNLAAANGGFVVNSDIQEDQNRLSATISFRVDSTKFNDVLTALHTLAVDVKSESTTGQDVTDQYVDYESQLRNLEASEAQLLDLMKQAGTVEEILAVQQQLTNTRGQIEQIKGQMQYLQQSSDLAMFNVSLEQSKLAVEFTADTRTVKAGKSVQFTSTVSGGFTPYTYEWSFGDGSTSTDASPSHIYHKSGTFTVTLKITDDKSNTANSNRADYITVQTGWTAGKVASDAGNALLAFFRFLASFFIGLGIFSPIWIIILVILYFAWWRRRKKKVS